MAAADPGEFRVGAEVELHGLSATVFNGRRAIVKSWAPALQRYQVICHGAGEPVAIKAINLRAASDEAAASCPDPTDVRRFFQGDEPQAAQVYVVSDSDSEGPATADDAPVPSREAVVAALRRWPAAAGDPAEGSAWIESGGPAPFAEGDEDAAYLAETQPLPTPPPSSSPQAAWHCHACAPSPPGRRPPLQQSDAPQLHVLERQCLCARVRHVFNSKAGRGGRLIVKPLMVFDRSSLASKLQRLSTSHQSIRTLSLWLIHHRADASDAAEVWARIRTARPAPPNPQPGVAGGAARCAGGQTAGADVLSRPPLRRWGWGLTPRQGTSPMMSSSSRASGGPRSRRWAGASLVQARAGGAVAHTPGCRRFRRTWLR